MVSEPVGTHGSHLAAGAVRHGLDVLSLPRRFCISSQKMKVGMGGATVNGLFLLQRRFCDWLPIIGHAKDRSNTHFASRGIGKNYGILRGHLHLIPTGCLLRYVSPIDEAQDYGCDENHL